MRRRIRVEIEAEYRPEDGEVEALQVFDPQGGEVNPGISNLLGKGELENVFAVLANYNDGELEVKEPSDEQIVADGEHRYAGLMPELARDSPPIGKNEWTTNGVELIQQAMRMLLVQETGKLVDRVVMDRWMNQAREWLAQ